jgi:hypothetical protein
VWVPDQSPVPPHNGDNQSSVHTFSFFIPASASVRVLNANGPTCVTVVVVVGFWVTIVHLLVFVSRTTFYSCASAGSANVIRTAAVTSSLIFILRSPLPLVESSRVQSEQQKEKQPKIERQMLR